ncbi:MAG: VTC domain-containing protein [Kiritimatiellae bacterium]|nr:VTC domain-containing protein [Kiritimatiellia bacterium]
MSSKASKGLRHEVKYIIPRSKVDMCRSYLDHHCAYDPAFYENTIKSVYFDTLSLSLLRQKENSIYYKYKVRLRWYEEKDGSLSPNAWLEIKTKFGTRTLKKRIKIDIDVQKLDRDPIGTAEKLNLSDYLEDEGHLEFHGILPVCCIQYKRCRYIDMMEGLRVSVDYDIEATHISDVIALKGYSGAAPTAVVEVKGSGAQTLSRLLYKITDFGGRKNSFSKYEICLKNIMGVTYE